MVALSLLGLLCLILFLGLDKLLLLFRRLVIYLVDRQELPSLLHLFNLLLGEIKHRENDVEELLIRFVHGGSLLQEHHESALDVLEFHCIFTRFIVRRVLTP